MSPSPLFYDVAELLLPGLVNLLLHQHMTSILLSFEPKVGIFQLHHELLSIGQTPDSLLLNLVQSLLLLLVG